MGKISVVVVAMSALAVVAPMALAGRQDTMTPQLVTTIVDEKLGRVLTTARQAGDLRLEQGAQRQGSLHRRVREGLAARHREGRHCRADARQGGQG